MLRRGDLNERGWRSLPMPKCAQVRLYRGKEDRDLGACWSQNTLFSSPSVSAVAAVAIAASPWSLLVLLIVREIPIRPNHPDSALLDKGVVVRFQLMRVRITPEEHTPWMRNWPTNPGPQKCTDHAPLGGTVQFYLENLRGEQKFSKLDGEHFLSITAVGKYTACYDARAAGHAELARLLSTSGPCDKRLHIARRLITLQYCKVHPVLSSWR